MALLLRHRLRPSVVPLLLAFLFAAYGDYSYNTSMCLQQHQCGNVSIEYPFYLYNETADLLGNDSSYCGYPGLEIRCEDSKQAILRLRGGNYRVSNINYTDFTVTVVDQEVFEDKSCPRVDHNVTFPNSSWLSTPDHTVDYLVFFLHCSFSSGLMPPPNIKPIGCGSFGGGPSYVWPGNEVPPPPELYRACQLVIQVPVLDLPYVSGDDTQWVDGGYGEALRSGFHLKWDQGKPLACIQCEQSDGKCGYKQTGGFMGCLCSGGRFRAHKCPGKPFEA
jgi:hypothetical protein